MPVDLNFAGNDLRKRKLGLGLTDGTTGDEDSNVKFARAGSLQARNQSREEGLQDSASLGHQKRPVQLKSQMSRTHLL